MEWKILLLMALLLLLLLLSLLLLSVLLLFCGSEGELGALVQSWV